MLIFFISQAFGFPLTSKAEVLNLAAKLPQMEEEIVKKLQPFLRELANKFDTRFSRQRMVVKKISLMLMSRDILVMLANKFIYTSEKFTIPGALRSLIIKLTTTIIDAEEAVINEDLTFLISQRFNFH